MALRLMRSRLNAGRSFATGIAKVASGGTNTTKTVNYSGNVRRFSAGAGNFDTSEKIRKGYLLAAGLAVHGLVLRYFVEKYVDKRLASLEVSQHSASSSTLSDEAKTDLRRYVDGKFSEAQRLSKSAQAEARAGVLLSKQHVDSVSSRLEHDLRADLARIRKQSDDSADKNNRVLAQQRAADEQKLAELTKEIEQIHGEVRSCDRKLDSALLQQNSRVADYAALSSEFAKLLQEFQKADRKLNTALSQVSSQAASEKKLADLTRAIEQIRGEVRSCDSKLDSALFQQNSQSANEGDYAELSSQVAKLRQEFQKTDRKVETALSQVRSQAASLGMSGECRNEIARLSQEIRNIDRKVNLGLSQMNSRAPSEGNFADCSNEIARLRLKVNKLERAGSDGNFTEYMNEIARLRQKVSRLEGTVDRLVEDSRKPPSDPGVGSSGPRAKKDKQD